MINVFRLGKRPEPGVSTGPRPLMVQLASHNMKNLIMESLYKLKNGDQRFKSIVVAHNMTKLERDQCKELVSEARSLAARDPAGEYLYRVRGPPGEIKILKFRKRQ